MDSLTKWVEAFSTSDQQATTIAELMIEHIVSRHGVPKELLSDRETNFLSDIMMELCLLLGIKKINTSGYPSKQRTPLMYQGWFQSSDHGEH